MVLYDAVCAYVHIYIYIYIYMYLMDNVPQLYPKYG